MSDPCHISTPFVHFLYLICAFCFHFDIHWRPENAIKSIVVDHNCKYALLGEWKNSTHKAQNIKFSCQKSFGRTALALETYVQRVSARTVWGYEDVRPDCAWTYVQGTFGRCRTKLNESFSFVRHKRRSFVQDLTPYFFYMVWNCRHFLDVKMSFHLRVGETSLFAPRYGRSVSRIRAGNLT